jgi:Arc/MetJ family transcription regulator
MMKERGLMRTTINVEDEIIRDLMQFTAAKTRTEAVNRAITEWVRLKRIDALRAKRGKIAWEGELDEMRDLEMAESNETHG